MDIVKKTPVPITGLILALFALGNLLQSIHPILKTIAGIIGGILYVLFLLKVIFDFASVRAEMQKPPVASVVPTITMATMLIATYVKPLSAVLAQAFWWIGVIGHALLIVYFALKFVRHFDIKSVFPSWYIVFVGISVAGVTAPAVGQLTIGQLSFWFGLAAFVILVPTVLYRIWHIKGMPPPTLPSLVIVAAPGSLLLAAYMNAFPEKNTVLAWILVVFSVAFFLLGLYYLLKQVSGTFIPTMSGFTFPMVISAVASAAANGYFAKVGNPVGWLGILATAQLIIASAAVLYVLIGYIRFLTAEKVAS